MYSICLLLFIIPLYFSHFFLPLGFSGFSIDNISGLFELFISQNSSFERQKVYLFFLLIFIAIIEGFIRYPYVLWNNLRKYFYIICILIIFPICSGFYFHGGIDSNFLVGSNEKHHGYYFYIGIIIFTLLIISSPRHFIRKYLIWSIYSAIIVAIIAIGEYIGGIWDIYGRSQLISMYSGRSSSTLGNPNYVAGFLLPFVPIFIFYIKNNTKGLAYFLIGLITILVGIFVTGSYIAIFITCLILLWYGISWIFREYSLQQCFILFFIFVFLVLSFGFFFLDSEKLLSFESRFILMQESLRIMIQSPVSFFIGFGPESLLTHFSGYRTVLINQYFPSSMLIDSSHNIIIDLIFQYGVPLFIYIVYKVFGSKIKFDSSITLSIVSLMVFLLFNVFVISHILFLILGIVILVRDPDIISNKKSK